MHLTRYRFRLCTFCLATAHLSTCAGRQSQLPPLACHLVLAPRVNGPSPKYAHVIAVFEHDSCWNREFQHVTGLAIVTCLLVCSVDIWCVTCCPGAPDHTPAALSSCYVLSSARNNVLSLVHDNVLSQWAQQQHAPASNQPPCQRKPKLQAVRPPSLQVVSVKSAISMPGAKSAAAVATLRKVEPGIGCVCMPNDVSTRCSNPLLTCRYTHPAGRHSGCCIASSRSLQMTSC